MEHELHATNVAARYFHTCIESLYYTSIAKPTPNGLRNARAFPALLKEYQSENIREVKWQGQTLKYVRKGKGNKLGHGCQASGICEVVVDTGLEHVGLNPKYQTYAAKIFRRANLYGQSWQEQLQGLNEYYGGYICEFYGYCQNYENYEGSDEDSEDGYETASEIAFEIESFEHMGFETSSDEGYESASEDAFETGSFCLLMRKYDCSLREVLDKQMKKNHNFGRPLLPCVAVNMMVQIAAGMKIVHQENIVHGDLKADNVLVYKNVTDNMPWGAYIGGFDISNSLCGTGYWRAPEILEATAKRRVDSTMTIPWTPLADVYSYAMTCYEILTGGIPLDGHPRTQYQDVSEGGLRPILPMDLNPSVRNLIVRCWHQDPLQRPTFDAILLEWRELLHESPLFVDTTKKLLSLQNMPSTEECISRLERQFENVRSKYPVQFFVRQNEVDFVKLGFHFVKCIKRVVRKFGSKPYIEHPPLPWSQWFARVKWIEKLCRLSIELTHALPYIEENLAIITLKHYILTSICEGMEIGNLWTEEENTYESQREAKLISWMENKEKRHALVNVTMDASKNTSMGTLKAIKIIPFAVFVK